MAKKVRVYRSLHCTNKLEDGTACNRMNYSQEMREKSELKQINKYCRRCNLSTVHVYKKISKPN